MFRLISFKSANQLIERLSNRGFIFKAKIKLDHIHSADIQKIVLGNPSDDSLFRGTRPKEILSINETGEFGARKLNKHNVPHFIKLSLLGTTNDENDGIDTLYKHTEENLNRNLVSFTECFMTALTYGKKFNQNDAFVVLEITKSGLLSYQTHLMERLCPDAFNLAEKMHRCTLENGTPEEVMLSEKHGKEPMVNIVSRQKEVDVVLATIQNNYIGPRLGHIKNVFIFTNSPAPAVHVLSNPYLTLGYNYGPAFEVRPNTSSSLVATMNENAIEHGIIPAGSRLISQDEAEKCSLALKSVFGQEFRSDKILTVRHVPTEISSEDVAEFIVKLYQDFLKELEKNCGMKRKIF